MMHIGASDTEGYDTDDEYYTTGNLTRMFTAVPSRSKPNCYSFFGSHNGKIYSTIWAAGLSDVDLGAIEEAQIKLIKKRIKKNIKEELRPEAEEKAFACLEKGIGRSPVHRRRSTFGGEIYA